MKISIIIPVYNSEYSLEKINCEIKEYFSKHTYSYEVIYVNDFSSDNSLKVLKRIQEYEQNILKVIDLKKNYGQQNAIFCGMHYAVGDLIVTMDDDLQHNIFDLDKLIEELNKGYNLVYGIYNNRNKKNIRNIGSRLTGLFFKYNFKNLKNKRVSSYRIFTKEILAKVLLCPYKFIYISALMLDNAKVSNVYVTQRKREIGTSGYNLKKLIKLFIKLNFYYSKLSIEKIKPKGKAFEISYTNNKEEIHEKNNDVGSWRLSVKCD